MHNNDVAAAEEQFSLLLEAFDEALAEGLPPPEIPPGLPDELRARLVRARACLEALQEQADEEPSVGDLETWLRDQGTAPARPPVGLQLGRFRVLRVLGSGGSGVVFLARDLRLSRQVALKVPRPEVLFTPELRRRFLQEATTAACLDHANLVPVHDADEEGPLCYIVSAYCPGPTLSAWLREHSGPVPARTAAQLVAALADAVAYIHGKGIIHRDIKPSNVLLEPVEEVAVGIRGGVSDELKVVPRLTDFGLAKLREGGADQTKTGVVLGTGAYMAPEQAQGRKEIGPAADVYALGVILYELLAGQVPFRGESDQDTLRQVIEAEPVAPRRLRPAVPRDLETICLKCLEKEPCKRYASAAELAGRLRLFLEGKPIPDRRPGWWERLLKWVRRRPTLAAFTALAALNVTALGSLLAGAVWPAVGADPIRPPLPGTRASAAQTAPSAKGIKNSIGMGLVPIPAGKFRMGSPPTEAGRSDDEDAHEVEITRPFYLGACEGTKRQFTEFVRATGYKTIAEQRGNAVTWRKRGQTDRDPVVCVDWHDAIAFCRWLSEKEGRTYRLPTEAEWEYSCRAGTTTRYHSGDDEASLKRVAHYRGSITSKPVGQLPGNAWDLHDMHGNVMEWCQDLYHWGYYKSSPRRDPQGPSDGTNRVVRGGSFYREPRLCRAAARLHSPVGFGGSDHVGFRVLLVVPVPAPAANPQGPSADLPKAGMPETLAVWPGEAPLSGAVAFTPNGNRLLRPGPAFSLLLCNAQTGQTFAGWTSTGGSCGT